MMDKPLRGIRVLELSYGPMASIGRQLAELGAHVTQSVPQDHSATLSEQVERLGKTIRSEASARDMAALSEMDILILDVETHNDIDPYELHNTYPDLIILAMTPFGLTGACKDWQLTEPVIHALSGELSRSGIPGRAPCLPPASIAYGCAASQAVFVILMSFWAKLRNGHGNLIDFSVFEAASLTLDPGYGIAGSAAAGVPIHKMPWGRPEGRQRYPIIACKDGFVRICVLAKRQWRAMFEWMGAPDAFADPSFEQLHIRFRDPDLIPAIAAFFSDKTGDELEAEGEARGVPVARVYSFADAIHSPQISARGLFSRRQIAPGLEALTSNGALEIDLERMAASDAPSDTMTEWTAEAYAPSEHPFEGLKVLDLGVIVVGAETGRLFADHGADVLKVENSAFADGMRQSKGADRVSQTFAAGNRNKKGLGLNLRSEKGMSVFKALVKDADIVLSNFKTGVLDTLGIDYYTLKAINPAIILADSSAFGPSGPWAKRMGYGPLVRASIGLCDLWKHEGDDEGFGDALTVHPDHLAARIGACGVVSLLIRRLRTGEGGRVSVAQGETALNTFGARVAEIDLAAQGKTAAFAREQDTPWGVFPCQGDDDWCAITVRDDADWRMLCAVMEQPALADRYPNAEARAAGRDQIKHELKAWLLNKTAREAAEILQARGIPAGAMLRVLELPDFPPFKDRETFTRATHPYISEEFPIERAPSRMTKVPAPRLNPAPLIGEHTREALKEWLDFTDDQIDQLVEDGDVEVAQ